MEALFLYLLGLTILSGSWWIFIHTIGWTIHFVTIGCRALAQSLRGPSNP
jgi:hypothetical protein